MVSVRTFTSFFFCASLLFQSSNGGSNNERAILVWAYREGNVDLCRSIIRGGALDDFHEPINKEDIFIKLDVVESLLSSGIAAISTEENYLEKDPSTGEFDVFLIPRTPLVTRMVVNVTVVKNWGNKTFKGGKKPIHLITSLPDVRPSIVKIILENGNDDVNTKADWGVTPLMLAAHNGNLEVVKFLVERGASVNEVASLLFSDEFEGRFALSKLFSKTALKSFDPRFYPSAVFSSILSNHTDITNYLLSKGANLNNKGQSWVPLFFSVQNGRKELFETLLRSGVDVNSKGVLSSTALHEVARTENVEMARILIKRGARLNATDALGWMPIHVASFYSKISGTKMIKLLVESGSSIDSLTDGGYSPLNLVEAGFFPSFLAFLQTNFDFLNQTEHFANLPEENMNKNHTDIIDSVIQLGASLNHQDDILGWSTLHWAAASGDLDTAKLLVKKGAVVSIKSKTGLNPYETAKYFGRKTVAEFLRTAKDLVSL